MQRKHIYYDIIIQETAKHRLGFTVSYDINGKHLHRLFNNAGDTPYPLYQCALDPHHPQHDDQFRDMVRTVMCLIKEHRRDYWWSDHDTADNLYPYPELNNMVLEMRIHCTKFNCLLDWAPPGFEGGLWRFVCRRFHIGHTIQGPWPFHRTGDLDTLKAELLEIQRQLYLFLQSRTPQCKL